MNLSNLAASVAAKYPGMSIEDIRPTATRGLWVVETPCGGAEHGCKNTVHNLCPENTSCLRQVTFLDDVRDDAPAARRFASWREHRRLLDMNPPRIFRAKLKSRREMERDIPRNALGWWHDVCPGKTLYLRDATERDLARCIRNPGTSIEPTDYWCELPEDGSLVNKLAIKSLVEVSLETVL
ncbi:hypothetical protein BSFA1_80710 (plasmid) [Burkholderia sp. SFA1]|uniref:Uncharacterized protein n=1 Tax=Burkholderia vietnamiensis (strain G4 / LMG 22486) TaxID=269482 RepID=A4JU87_BURVG|nr:hypothetical protein Bcep1808_6953 [Burkholderia vietnamiensis G4]AET95326.1 hypothetical protein BYI23_E001650 [Burkholderia sp. YI23]MCB4349998.1 hypothetical protein [Burkholderia vietnamiensis]BBQ02943.1 hypothetical protein BSFA1_80710 [Burkholderia sp. SFA1]